MTTCTRRLFNRIATKGVVAVLPVALASAYASGIFMSPPSPVALDYALVSEITTTPSTVGMADSGLIYMSPADISKTLDQLQSIGVNNVRILVPWAVIEQSDDNYYWTQMDNVMTAATARNMGVMADVNSTPLWAAAPNTFPGAGAPQPAKFAEFLQQVVNRYGADISAYEIWNEPNYWYSYQPIDPVTYTALLQAAWGVIKDPVNGDPTATVVAGALGAGFTTGWTMSPVDFVAGMMAAGAGNYFDALSFHPYQQTLPFSQGYTFPGLGTPLEQLDAIKIMIGAAKKVWISEYGLPTSDVTQQQQSAYIKDLLDYWQTYSQAGPVFIYTTRDALTGSADPEKNYGIYNTDWTPKLAADMLAAWIAAHPGVVIVPPVINPSNPGAAIAAFFQSLVQQITQAFNQFISIGQTLVSAITNFVSSIVTALTGGPAAVTAPPPTLRLASVAEPAADLVAPDLAGDVATLAATPDAASVVEESVVAESVVDEPVETASAETASVVEEPVVAEPVVDSTPAATEAVAPAVTETVETETETETVATTPSETADSVKTEADTTTDSPASSAAKPTSSTSSTSAASASTGSTTAKTEDSKTNDSKTDDSKTDDSKTKDQKTKDSKSPGGASASSSESSSSTGGSSSAGASSGDSGE